MTGHRILLLAALCTTWACASVLVGRGESPDTGAVDADGDGYVEGEDCDDSNVGVHPGATEIPYNDIDEDCDDSTLDDDADHDGYPLAVDCDDNDPLTNPGVQESCDGEDNDCDEMVDEEAAGTFYADADGDGYGDPAQVTQTCDATKGLVDNADDCDDGDADFSPDATEWCDEVDNDCDGTVDEGDAADARTWYDDADEDHYGDPTTGTQACDAPAGMVSNDEDCDDGDANQNPDATWYRDNDGDGYGTPYTGRESCEAPDGFAPNNLDCDDTDAAFNPGADEVCDGEDNDCDDAVDEDDDDVTDLPIWYLDLDEDGYGTGDVTAEACSAPSWFVDNDEDCDDTDPELNPDTTWHLDVDADGYGSSDVAETGCTEPLGLTSDSSDCDDGDPEIRPDATELCDEIDNDCDGEVDDDDDDVTGTTTWYADTDDDGYGDPDNTTDACEVPAGYTDDDNDCDDGDATSWPAADELCDGADNNCNGEADEGLAGSEAACAVESCAAVKADKPDAADGEWWLDPTDSGTAALYTCDMTTDGGGWTLIADWDRSTAGEDLSAFEAEFTEVYNNMTRWTTDTGSVYWCDWDATGDALVYSADVDVPNGGESMLDLSYLGTSIDGAGVAFWNRSGSTDSDIVCRLNSVSASYYNSTEISLLPGYTCSSTTSGTFSFEDVYLSDVGSEIDAFFMGSWMYDGSCGDRSDLYWLAYWVR